MGCCTPKHFSQKDLPFTKDLRGRDASQVFDQGDMGSCTGNAIAFAFYFCLHKEHLQEFVPSRLFIYWNERNMEGDTKMDAGASIHDGITAVQNLGVCPESMWPYKRNLLFKKPSAACFEEAHKYRATSCGPLQQTLCQLKACLARGYPFVFGFNVYTSFERIDRSGVMPVPKSSE